MAKIELFGTAFCPYTDEMREWLEWRGCEFVEYDVESDLIARERMRLLVGNPCVVPVLVEEGIVVRVGWEGRGCTIA